MQRVKLKRFLNCNTTVIHVFRMVLTIDVEKRCRKKNKKTLKNVKNVDKIKNV